MLALEQDFLLLQTSLPSQLLTRLYAPVAEPHFQDKMRAQILQRLSSTYRRVGQHVLASSLHVDGSKLDALVTPDQSALKLSINS